MTIPTQTMRKIIKKTTGLRAGTSTGETLARVLEDEATLISRTAGRLAVHSGRQTVSSDDVLLAVDMLREE